MAVIFGAAALHAAPLGNLSPADALKAFETEPGFAVTLVAAEPLTIDPVAIAFDERGRLFVVEGRDYPVVSPDGRALGVIALLEDTDGDGRMDKRSDFATGFKFPTGVMCWRGGVIVTAAPDVWWLRDTNGDGQHSVIADSGAMERLHPGRAEDVAGSDGGRAGVHACAPRPH